MAGTLSDSLTWTAAASTVPVNIELLPLFLHFTALDRVINFRLPSIHPSLAI